ncbi:hypothetical protein ACU8KH_04711 [Lachancea thermotolerans]
MKDNCPVAKSGANTVLKLKRTYAAELCLETTDDPKLPKSLLSNLHTGT